MAKSLGHSARPPRFLGGATRWGRRTGCADTIGGHERDAVDFLRRTIFEERASRQPWIRAHRAVVASPDRTASEIVGDARTCSLP